MDGHCELLETCGFFKKYKVIDDLVCEELIATYCKGPKMNECKRKQYRTDQGLLPSDDMLPTGEMIAE